MDIKIHIPHLCVVVELHTMIFQILHHRKHHRLVLVVLRKTKRRKIRKAANMMNITLHITLHLQSRLVVLEREHRPPIQPEIRIEHFIVKHIRDLDIVQVFVRRHKQLRDLQRPLVRQTKLLIRMRIFSTIDRRPTQRKIRIILIQPIILIQNRVVLILDRRNRTKQIPHALEMIIHFPAAPHDITNIRQLIAIQSATRMITLFINMNILARHLPIPH